MQRDYYRKTFRETWQKYQASATLSELEKQLLSVILQHPEYHSELEKPDVSAHFSTDENPYLHLGLHVGLLEQLSTQRPVGINRIYENLITQCRDAHEAQHQMMNVIAELIWEAQKNNTPPNDEEYLKKLQALL